MESKKNWFEQNELITSRIEFRDEGPDREHYALTEKGQLELSQAMSYWTKMTEVLEDYREVHKSIFRYRSEISRDELSKLLIDIGGSLKGKVIEITIVNRGSRFLATQ